MAKRRADKQLNKDDVDVDDEVEDGGEFKQADANTLSNRIIRTAKRRSMNSSSTTASPLVNFAGFSNGPKDAPFSFFSQISSKSNDVQPPTSSATDSTRNRDLSALKSLNLSFTKWIQQHLEENPFVILTPVFRDYEKHLATLNVEGVSSKPSLSAAAPFSFSSSVASSDEKKDKKPELTFSAASSNFPALSTSTSGFSFGLTTETQSKKEDKPSFSFSNATSNPSVTPKVDVPKPAFSFGLNGGLNTLFNAPKENTEPAGTTDTAGSDEPSDEPPKFDFVPVSEDGCVFDMRCKVFFKKDESFVARGVGTLFLKTVDDGKTQIIARADTAVGSILLNFILTADMPLERMGKNNILVVCLPTPDSKPPPSTILIRVKSGEERDRLFNEMKKLRGG